MIDYRLISWYEEEMYIDLMSVAEKFIHFQIFFDLMSQPVTYCYHDYETLLRVTKET